VKTADKLLATHEQRLLKFAARASAWFDDDARPRLVVAASAPLKGGPLKIGELRQRCDNAAEFGELMDRWEDLAKEVLVYRAWWEAIEKASLESVDDNLNDAEKKQLRRAKREVVEAVQELFTLQSAADFRRYEPDRNLVTAYNLLAPLAAKSGTPRPAVEDLRLPADPQIAEGGMQLASRCQAEPDAEGRGRALGEATPGQLNMVEEAERWLKSAPDFRDPSPPELRSTRRYIADALVVILAVAGGVVAGLSAFYFGKPFGTVADYVTIALVGSASAVLVRQLNHAIDLLSQSPGGPPLISKLKPTTLPATATSGAAPAAADESEAAHAAPGGSPPAARAPNRSPVPV
jgi:hypothetical protein